MEDTGSQLIKKKMNLSFCFFFSGMFPSIWWWERGVSEGINILCIILQCWVAKLDEHGTKLTNSRKDKLEKSDKSIVHLMLIAVVLAS